MRRLLKSATRDTMWTQPTPSDGLGRLAYALGWQFGAVEDLKIVGHSGGQQGTSTMIILVRLSPGRSWNSSYQML